LAGSVYFISGKPAACIMYNIDMVPEVNTAIIRGDLPELSGIGKSK
jgi:hypothetical protein